MSKRKIKKYDLINLVTIPNRAENTGKCYLGDFLVLYIKPEGIGLFGVSSKNRYHYSLKEFKQKFEYKWS